MKENYEGNEDESNSGKESHNHKKHSNNKGKKSSKNKQGFSNINNNKTSTELKKVINHYENAQKDFKVQSIKAKCSSRFGSTTSTHKANGRYDTDS